MLNELKNDPEFQNYCEKTAIVLNMSFNEVKDILLEGLKENKSKDDILKNGMGYVMDRTLYMK